MKAEKEKVSLLIKTAKGQMEGILKMVEEDRYCVDISNQLLAVQSILNKANREILRAHIESCIKDAFREGREEEKIEEVILLLEKMTK